jgi:C1A family cysteine protease
MLKVITLILLIAITSQSQSQIDQILSKFKDSHPKDLFKVFHTVNKKHNEYDLNSEEGIRRFKNFEESLKRIKELNAERGSEVYGLTPLSDLSNEEFFNTGLNKKISVDSSNTSHNVNDLFRINWMPYMNPVKDQGKCGSCWAFAILGAVESNYKLQFGENISLSEQYLVDCDFANSGCDGGNADPALKFMKNYGVIDNRKINIPYSEGRT